MAEYVASLLTIDCGNSTIGCRRQPDGARLVIASEPFDVAAFGAFLRSRPPQRALVASVVRAPQAAIEHELRAVGAEVLVVGRDVLCPLPLRYDTPSTLGVDRWLGALAAHRRFGRSLVIDCGSATTCNLIDADGTFCGGSIAPGLRAFVAGMLAVTPALPAPDLDALPAVPARTSQAAVDSGVLLGYCGLVERLVAEHLRAARGPTQVLVTGGNAERLRRRTRLDARYEPDLVYDGLSLLAEGAPWKS